MEFCWLMIFPIFVSNFLIRKFTAEAILSVTTPLQFFKNSKFSDRKWKFFVINNTSVLSFENGNWQGTSRLAFDRSSEWLPELNVGFVSPFYRLHNKNFVWVVWNTRPFVAMKMRRFESISQGQLRFDVWTWPYGPTYLR